MAYLNVLYIFPCNLRTHIWLEIVSIIISHHQKHQAGKWDFLNYTKGYSSCIYVDCEHKQMNLSAWSEPFLILTTVHYWKDGTWIQNRILFYNYMRIYFMYCQDILCTVHWHYRLTVQWINAVSRHCISTSEPHSNHLLQVGKYPSVKGKLNWNVLLVMNTGFYCNVSG